MIRVLQIIIGSFIIAHHDAATMGKKRVPKFEFYVYNDFGNLVKQYLTSEQIQELLRGPGQPAGEEQIKYLLGKESEEFPMPRVKEEDIMTQLPLSVPSVSHNDSPGLRRVMTKVWKLIRKAESDRTSTTTTSKTTTKTTTTTNSVQMVEMDENLTQHHLTNLIKEKDLLCLKFAKKCIKLGKPEIPSP